MMASHPALAALVEHPAFSDRDSTYIRWYPKTLSAPPAIKELSAVGIRPSGAYVHVPFCDRLCRFCPFNKRVSDQEQIAAYTKALLGEIALYGRQAEIQPLDYVYFGGGTPSVLIPSAVNDILSALDGAFGLSSGVEVTLESHPTHISEPFLRAMLAAGVTRFSTGVQAFDDHALLALGAQHTAADVERALAAGSKVGVLPAVDLLFRCEGQTQSHWETQLRRVVEEGIEHVSCYSLVLKSDRRQPSVLDEAKMTLLMREVLGGASLRHYASCASGGFDYAAAGRECTYETRHWRAPQDEFLGLGPGAFGFVANSTTVNGLDLRHYADSVAEGRLPLVSATMASVDELQRRYFTLGAKTLEIPLRPFRDLFGIESIERFQEEFALLRKWEFIEFKDDRLILTDLGSLFVDTVSAVFFSPTERDVPHPEEPEIRRMEVYGTAARA